MLTTLNDLGMGRKETIETIVEQEAEILLQKLRDQIKNKSTFKPNGFFLPTTSNVIWRMVTGKKTKHDDPGKQTL